MLPGNRHPTNPCFVLDIDWPPPLFIFSVCKQLLCHSYCALSVSHKSSTWVSFLSCFSFSFSPFHCFYFLFFFFLVKISLQKLLQNWIKWAKQMFDFQSTIFCCRMTRDKLDRGTFSNDGWWFHHPQRLPDRPGKFVAAHVWNSHK